MFKTFLKKILVIIALLVIIIEDLFWSATLVITNKLDKFKYMQKLENWMASLNPYQALALFIAPDGVIIPLKFYLMDMMHSGMYLQGMLIFILVKVIATAIYAKIFMICKPQLLQIGWFKWIHDKVVEIKNKYYDKIKNTNFYKNLQEFKQNLRLKMLKIKESLNGKPGRFSRLKTFIRAKQKPA